jgi:hypothetical protein
MTVIRRAATFATRNLARWLRFRDILAVMFCNPGQPTSPARIRHPPKWVIPTARTGKNQGGAGANAAPPTSTSVCQPQVNPAPAGEKERHRRGFHLPATKPGRTASNFRTRPGSGVYGDSHLPVVKVSWYDPGSIVPTKTSRYPGRACRGVALWVGPHVGAQAEVRVVRSFHGIGGRLRRCPSLSSGNQRRGCVKPTQLGNAESPGRPSKPPVRPRGGDATRRGDIRSPCP